MTKGLPGADVRKIIEALGFDPTNHHNALKCPYCNPEGLAFTQPPSTPEGEAVRVAIKALTIAAQLADNIRTGDMTPLGAAKLIADNSRAALTALRSSGEGV